MSAQILPRAPARMRLALMAVFAVGLVLAARLFYWQIIRYDDLSARAKNETVTDTKIQARRGSIMTRDGQLLAEDSYVYTIKVDPQQVTPAERPILASQLAPILKQSAESILTQISADSSSVVLAQDVQPFEGEAALELERQPGVIGLDVTSRRVRVYPGGSFAANIVGFVNTEDKPANGIESFRNADLRGVDGSLSGAGDALHDMIPFDLPTSQAPVDGADITLTIDAGMQRVVETELANAIRDSRSSGGSIIVMDPKSGAILALAVWPTANLNDYYNPVNLPRLNNPTVSAQYEPGSVFKIVTTAAALDTGTVSPGTYFDDNGSVYVGGSLIKNHDDIAPGHVSLIDVLRMSLNVEAAKMSVGLGADRFYQYVHGFGFGALTRIDLADEIAGTVKSVGDGRWHDADLGTNAFGQGISVTPIQMITAVAAVANQGKLMQPFITQQIRYSDGNVYNATPTVVRPVIRPETAQTLTGILADAIIGESDNKAIVPGYRIAGKTGTASIPIPGGYDPVNTVASFVGYLPADDPRFVILVKLDKPKSSEWGSVVASPVFASVAKQLVEISGLPPDSVRLAGK